jgi:hypothetical protein
MKADSISHTLRVEAPGYRTQTVPIALERAVDAKIKLDPLPVAWQGGGPKVIASHPNVPPLAGSAAASSSGATHASCTLPYYIDEQGIKRVRPECLK